MWEKICEPHNQYLPSADSKSYNDRGRSRSPGTCCEKPGLRNRWGKSRPLATINFFYMGKVTTINGVDSRRLYIYGKLASNQTAVCRRKQKKNTLAHIDCRLDFWKGGVRRKFYPRIRWKIRRSPFRIKLLKYSPSAIRYSA